MQRLKLVQQDAVTSAPLPFSSSRTRLQLLGFLLSAEQRYPAPLEMLAETGGKRYRIGYTGYAHQLEVRNAYDMREPDIAAAPDATIKVGERAFALAPDQIITGSLTKMRHNLREMLRTEKLPPASAMMMLDYLQEQTRQVTLAAAYDAGGVAAYKDAQHWLGLRERINQLALKTPAAARPERTRAPSRQVQLAAGST